MCKAADMKIICDTHIWYNIGNGHIDPKPIIDSGNKLVANYNNINELVHTHNIVDNENGTRKAVQAIFTYSKNHAILESPLLHLKKLADPSFEMDWTNHIEPMLTFTEKFAQGEKIESGKEEEFKKLGNARKDDLQKAADTLNEEAKKIKEAQKGKPQIKREERIVSSRKLISHFVSVQTKSEGLPENFDWNKIELLENVLTDFFISLEKGAAQITANDWFDLFLLAYVQPGDKVWTRENKWKNIIDNSDMKKYRFDQ